MAIKIKPWGKEDWLVLNDKYCLKRLYINKGEKISLQYHDLKKETMLLESGICELYLDGDAFPMHIQKPYTIQPKRVHRLTAYTDSVILEVSTPEVDDIVRLEDKYDRTRYEGEKQDQISQIKGENT